MVSMRLKSSSAYRVFGTEDGIGIAVAVDVGNAPVISHDGDPPRLAANA
jgi:hypothetical protein